MNLKEIIKEIDPDFVRCVFCEKVKHTSQMIYMSATNINKGTTSYQYICKDFCEDVNAGKRNNPRTRS